MFQQLIKSWHLAVYLRAQRKAHKYRSCRMTLAELSLEIYIQGDQFPISCVPERNIDRMLILATMANQLQMDMITNEEDL